jgi:hypothetical protein
MRMSSAGPATASPATLPRMSMRPNSASSAPKTRSISAKSEMSAVSGSASEFHDLVRGVFVAGCIAIEQHDVGARFGQRQRHGAAHALRCAGDHGDAIGEVEELHGRN